MTVEDAVRQRPFMYIGNDGIAGLLEGLLIDSIQICNTDKITFEISLLADNDFVLGIKTDGSTTQLYEAFTTDKKDLINHSPGLLQIISSNFEIKKADHTTFEVHFSLDKNVIPDSTIDYFKLAEKMLQVALLNRYTEIITLDKRTKFHNQNYFHFPQGIFYLFDKTITEVLGKPAFKLIIDQEIKDNYYQIGLAYRTDWFPSPTVISFANNIHTSKGGSLVDGILDGLVSSCKIYAKENNLTSLKINRKKFANGLILVCAVRGQDFKYGGSFKQALEDNTIRSQANKLVSNSVLDFFKTQKEKADKFLWRFDTTQLTSRMY